MAEAVMMLSDTAEGQIKMDLVYDGGFKPESHAHQHMRLLVGAMNQIANAIPGSETERTTDEPASDVMPVLQDGKPPGLVILP